MFEGAKIGVVVPCYNESQLISRVLDTMPGFVDHVYVVDDRSKDNTVEIVQNYIARTPDRPISLIVHEVNQGVGGAITTGYRKAAEDQMDIMVVMAGDAQMNPDELDKVIQPIVDGEADYVKGNRLATGEAWHMIPRSRYLGNVMLSMMTKVASGYWHVFDSQTGYTAITRQVIETINWDALWKRYGYPNHLLIMLNIQSYRVVDVPVEPIYNIGEVSGIRIWRVIIPISMLLLRGFIQRLFQKFVVRDAHPLVFFYLFGTLSFIPGLLLGAYLFIYRLFVGPVAATSGLFAMFLVLFGLNFLMFAMWFDMDYNRRQR
jgi:glycosyltransferase involved in cell wall biosynthesis